MELLLWIVSTHALQQSTMTRVFSTILGLRISTSATCKDETARYTSLACQGESSATHQATTIDHANSPGSVSPSAPLLLVKVMPVEITRTAQSCPEDD